jgi:CRP-like cAMP-binding protein
MFSAPIHNCRDCPLGAASTGRCPFTPSRLPADAVLVAQGEHQPNLYFVREGLAQLRSVSVEGEETSLTIRGPGVLLGTEAFEGSFASQEVRALTELGVCSLRAEEVETWVGPKGSPARAILSLVVSELHHGRQDLRLREGGCLGRVARFLMASRGMKAHSPLRKQLVARMLGMRPETFSRCLRSLEERGLVEAGPELRVTDPGALAAIAERNEP